MKDSLQTHPGTAPAAGMIFPADTAATVHPAASAGDIQTGDSLSAAGITIPEAAPTSAAAPGYSRMFYEQSMFPQADCYHPEVKFRYSGMPAEPLPYRMRSDDGVTGLLLCCFVMTMLIFARNKKYIRQQVQDFFFGRINRQSLFSVTTGREMRHTLFLHMQTGLLTGLFAFSYTLSVCDMFMAPVSHFVLLGIYVVCCWCYLGIKQLLYTFVNWIFFDKEQRIAWMKAYSFLISAEGLLFFPLALVTVYLDLHPHNVILWFCLLMGLAKLLLFYKTFSIFFPNFYGLLHLIVYLCALEILPACTLWKALTLTNNILL